MGKSQRRFGKSVAFWHRTWYEQALGFWEATKFHYERDLDWRHGRPNSFSFAQQIVSLGLGGRSASERGMTQ